MALQQHRCMVATHAGRKAALLAPSALCPMTGLQRPTGTLCLRPFTATTPSSSSLRSSSTAPPRRVSVRAVDQEPPSTKNTEFGYSRKDVLIICAGLIGVGYALYYGLQATGMEPGFAGNWVQLIIFVGICVGWVSTYVYRVATKQMTYVKQLEQYEEAVMRKRLEELTDAELQQMLTDVDKDKGKKP